LNGTTHTHTLQVGINRLTDVTALAVLVAGQPGVGRVVASDHPPVMVDDGVQVVDGRLLHLVLLADAELTEIQIPARRDSIRGRGRTPSYGCCMRDASRNIQGD